MVLGHNEDVFKDYVTATKANVPDGLLIGRVKKADLLEEERTAETGDIYVSSEGHSIVNFITYGYNFQGGLIKNADVILQGKGLKNLEVSEGL